MEQQRAFEDIKEALTREPVLALPDFNKPFILMTDGSKTGLGAVLSQDHGDTKERVVAYASKKTGPLEQNYSACELECLALVWAVKHFREYLLGRTTTVVTDHWALKWLLTLENAAPRLQRWRMTLQEYNLDIVHKAGKQHSNADFMSRMYLHFGDREAGGSDDDDEGPPDGPVHSNREVMKEQENSVAGNRGNCQEQRVEEEKRPPLGQVQATVADRAATSHVAVMSEPRYNFGAQRTALQSGPARCKYVFKSHAVETVLASTNFVLHDWSVNPGLVPRLSLE